MEPQQQQNQQALNEDCGDGSGKGSFLCRQSSTRWTPTADQIRILKDLYYNNGVRSPSADQIQRISARLRQYGKIEGKNVFYWFQNHKARERQKKRFTTTTNDHVPMQSPTTVANNKYRNISYSPTSLSSTGVLTVGQIGNYGYGSITMEKSFRIYLAPPLSTLLIYLFGGVNLFGIEEGFDNDEGSDNDVGYFSNFDLDEVSNDINDEGSKEIKISTPLLSGTRDCSISACGSSTSVGESLSHNFGWVRFDPTYSSSYTFFDHKKFMEEGQKDEDDAEEEAAAPQIETLPLFPMHSEEVNGFCSNVKPRLDSCYSGWYRSEDGYTGSRASLELSLNPYAGRSQDSI